MLWYALAFLMSFFLDAAIMGNHLPVIGIVILVIIMILGFRRDCKRNCIRGSWQIYALLIVPTAFVMLCCPIFCTIIAFTIVTLTAVTHLVCQFVDPIRYERGWV
jgi:hypothetical protein